MHRLNELISTEFERVLKEQRLTIKAAARALSISRQSMHAYLKGQSIPRGRVLTKARELWGFRIADGQVSLDTGDRAANINQHEAVQLPLDFQQTVDAIRREDLHVDFKRRGATLNIEVTIDIPGVKI